MLIPFVDLESCIDDGDDIDDEIQTDWDFKQII